jgi:hypothetical protein
MERWFLKTMINMVTASPGNTFWAGGEAPPARLVRVAFGEHSLVPPQGLYAATDIGRSLQLASPFVLGFTPISHSSGALLGAFFELLGLRWILWLSDEPLPTQAIPHLVSDWDATPPHRHLREYRFLIRRRISHILHFRWSVGA